VCVLLSHPDIDDSALSIRKMFELSSIFEVSLSTRHFETVVVDIFGCDTFSLLLNKSKHSSLFTPFFSDVHFAISAFISALADKTKEVKIVKTILFVDCLNIITAFVLFF
jgi:hypothetical protein